MWSFPAGTITEVSEGLPLLFISSAVAGGGAHSKNTESHCLTAFSEDSFVMHGTFQGNLFQWIWNSESWAIVILAEVGQADKTSS